MNIWIEIYLYSALPVGVLAVALSLHLKLVSRGNYKALSKMFLIGVFYPFTLTLFVVIALVNLINHIARR